MICQICKKEFSLNSFLYNFSVYHPGIFVYPCGHTFCPRQYSTLQSLTKHMRKHHKDPHPNPNAPSSPALASVETSTPCNSEEHTTVLDQEVSTAIENEPVKDSTSDFCQDRLLILLLL